MSGIVVHTRTHRCDNGSRKGYVIPHVQPSFSLMARKRRSKVKSLRATPVRKNRVKKNRKSRTVGRYAYPLNMTPTMGKLWYNPLVQGCPDAIRIRLRYVVPFQTVLDGAHSSSALKFSSNAFDVDSALGSTSMAYFAEYATLFARFRTLGMRYKFDVATLETHGIGYIHGFSSLSVAGSGVGLNYAETPYMHQFISGGINADSTHTVSGQITVAQLFGSEQPLVDDTFTGSTTSSTLPASATMYLYIGAVSTAFLAAGYDVTGFIELDIMFYDRNTLLS